MSIIISQEQESCRKLLNNSGLPCTDDWVIVRSDGGWTQVLPREGISARAAGKSARRVRGLQLGLRMEGSPEWYAGTILRIISELENARRQVQAIAFHALQLGHLRTNRFWKLLHEKEAIARRAEKQKLVRISAKGGAVRQKQGAANSEHLFRIAQKLAAAEPALLEAPFKLAEMVEAEIRRLNVPAFGIRGEPLKVDTIARKLKHLINKGKLTAG